MKITKELGGRRQRPSPDEKSRYGETSLRYVTEAGVSTRVTNALERIRICTMAELALISEQKLSNSKGIGPHIVAECRKALKQHGYQSVLNGEVPDKEAGET